MEKRVRFVTDRQGRPVANATIRVTEYPGGALATIYSDDGVTQKANPTSSDATGRYEYYAANGHYTEVITTNAGAQPAINDILFDDSLTTNQQFVAATGTGNAMVVAAFATGYTLADGDELRVRAPGANTVNNPTIQLPGVGTLTITRAGGRPLAKYDIKGSGHELHLRYRAAPARMELVNVGRLDVINANQDFGVIGDGIASDLAAMQAVVAAAVAGSTVHVYGTPLLDGTLTINKKIRLIFGGGLGINSVDRPGSYFIKGAGVNGNGVELTAQGIIWDGGGLVCEPGNSGDGIAQLANSVQLNHVYVEGAGNDNIRVGHDLGTNCNSYRMQSPRSRDAGRHGIFVSDAIAPTGPNANAGIISNPSCSGNAGAGLCYGNADFNTLEGGVFENNNYGVQLIDATGTRIIGGDREANTTADGYIGAGSTLTALIDVRESEIWIDETTAVGSTTLTAVRTRDTRNLLARESQLEWPLILSGTTTATKAVTSISRTGTTATAVIAGHTFAVGDRFHLLPGNVTHSADHPYGGSYTVDTAPDANTITFTVDSRLPANPDVTGMVAVCGFPTGTIAKGAWRRDGSWCRFTHELKLDTGALNALVTGQARLFGLPFRVGSPCMAPVFGAFFANMDVFQLVAFADTSSHAFALYRTPALAAAAAALETVAVGDIAINANTFAFVSGSYKIG